MKTNNTPLWWLHGEGIQEYGKDTQTFRDIA